jgi:hypothetical protein
LRKTQYLPLIIIAIIATITMASLPVKASPYVNFFINQPDGYIHGVDPVGEYIYQDLTTTKGLVSVGDKRLTPVGSYAAGSFVASGDSDIGKTIVSFKTAALPYERHTDPDANGLYEWGEYIYQDKDTPTGYKVSAGDVRLTPVGSYNAGSTVVAGDSDIGMTLVVFKTGTTSPFEKHTENIEINGNYDPAKVFVDVYVDCDIPDGDTTGIVGWNIIVQVDPDVLVPYGWKGAATGYFLADFIVRAGTGGTASLAGAAKTDTLEVSEQITPTPTIGAGNQTIPDEYLDPAAKLVTLIFISKSETDYSKIDLLFYDKAIGGDPNNPGKDGISDDYMTPDGLFNPATVIDGDYNAGPVPEFPLGIGVLMALAPMIPIIYLWRTRPKRRVTNQ